MSGKFIDAYAVLEIGPDADDAAVRARHRDLAKQFHPDRGGRAADGELMMRINRARDVLLDPVARATLDEELARRRRKAAAAAAAGKPTASASPTPPLSRDRRWRAEWGATTRGPPRRPEAAAPPPRCHRRLGCARLPAGCARPLGRLERRTPRSPRDSGPRHRNPLAR